MTVRELIETLKTCDEKSEVKIEHWNSTVSSIEELIDKLVLVEDTEYKEFQAIDVEPVDDRFIIITTTIK